MLKNFNAVRITVASPQDILNWSHGEVTKAETINYRTFRCEPSGLMAEEIFGPTKDFECYCGKYKKIRYKGIVCDRCGVEVTHKRVRRERMGHIKLASPVTHVWFANGVPNKLSIILDIPQKKLQTVVYYARYVVTSVGVEDQQAALKNLPELKKQELEGLAIEEKEKIDEISESFRDQEEDKRKEVKDKDKLKLQLERISNNEKLEVARVKSAFKQKQDNIEKKFSDLKSLISNIKIGSTLSEEENSLLEEYEMYFYSAGMGAEAIKELLEKLDLDKEIEQMEEELISSKSQLKRAKTVQRIRIMKGMRKSGLNPAWLILDVLPVIPPDLRPIIQLPGGRFATYDLNDLYRRVINRNNRLKRLINLGAPEIILRNEKRMLQQSVDALLDNNHMPSAPALNTRGMPFKSLSDMLRGKQGRFRQNLLGKRVDYSGRAVIVAGPELKFDQCGLPKNIALELFRPFIVKELIARGYAANPTRAKIIFESKPEEVWDILDEVIKDRPVLLNRAPSLHRYSILAFYPVLVEGNAIKLHPMVCKGFAADFDGDQMAVHLPLSEKAVEEVKARMFVKDNMLHLRDKTPIVNVSKDMAMGIYFLTLIREDETKIAKVFSNEEDLITAYELGQIKFFEPIKLLRQGEVMTTSAGRVIFNKVLPEDYGFINKALNNIEISNLSADIFRRYGSVAAINFLDDVKELGFKFATKLGISSAMGEFRFGGNEVKERLLREYEIKEDELIQSFYEGMITENELQRIKMDEWNKTVDKIYDEMWRLAQESDIAKNLVDLDISGATPVKSWVKQISGVRGSVTDMEGRIVTLPLKGNFEKGLNNFEYFAASKATRKGYADVALKTAESGYLTRRLVDVSQDIIVKIEDCGTEKGLRIAKDTNRIKNYANKIFGRYTAEDVVDSKTNKVVIKAGEDISLSLAQEIANNDNIDSVVVRSPLTCNVSHGVCTKCYGYDNGTSKPVQIGEAVGIIAAQALGEPTTQLTLKSKSDARASKTDVTQGFPRVEELMEARTPKGLALLAEISGTVKIIDDKKKITVRVVSNKKEVKKYSLEETDEVVVKNGASVKAKDVIVVKKDKTEVRAPITGKLKIDKKANSVLIEADKELESEKTVESFSDLIVKDGDTVEKGDQLTYGSSDPKELARLKGIDAAQRYIIDSVQDVYSIQGLDVDDRHLEIVTRQMGRYGIVTEGGDSSSFLPGDYADVLDLLKENHLLEKKGLKPLKFERTLLGVTNASIRTESFLSAASFEQQVRVLTDAALIGKIDHLRGLKENVIIGRPIPVGEELVSNNKEEIDEVFASVKILKEVEDSSKK